MTEELHVPQREPHHVHRDGGGSRGKRGDARVCDVLQQQGGEEEGDVM